MATQNREIDISSRCLSIRFVRFAAADDRFTSQSDPKAADTIPEARVVAGRCVEFCFAYARQGEAFLGPDAQDQLMEQDRLLADSSALVTEVPEEERRVPCVISKEAKTLASVSFSELTGKYNAVIELTG